MSHPDATVPQPGTVGIWTRQLDSQPTAAAEEAVAELEQLGYPTLDLVRPGVAQTTRSPAYRDNLRRVGLTTDGGADDRLLHAVVAVGDVADTVKRPSRGRRGPRVRRSAHG